jgi:chromosome segregation ATPase
VYSAENAGSTPDQQYAQEKTMKRPSKYDRMGTAVIKKDNGFLYLTEDIDPLLDQMSGHIQDAKDAQVATSAAKVDLAQAESQVTDRDHQIADLKRELAETQEYLADSEGRASSMASMLTRISEIAHEGV